jgi:DNA invertase Pin-like site-specific DNA recombinase/predicted transcriptional regulator
MKITKVEPAAPALPTRKKVAAYARVSVTRDRTEHSLSAQVSYYSDLIQRNPEWIYSGVYADLGQTGTNDNRDEWRRMLADCEAGKIDILLTKSISRFARNTLDLLETVRRLKELGVEVRFEKENINSMSGDGELMMSILASFAQEESFSTSENIKWRMRTDFQKGKQHPTYLYGYRWDGENFVIEPTEAEVVREVFRMYLDGMSSRAIARELTAKGIKTFFGGNFCEHTLLKMLENEKYIGTVIMQKTFVEDHISKKKVRNNGELPRYVIDDAHPAIIDKETFEAVQARLNERKVKVERTVFTSKIICEKCGCSFQRCSRKNRAGETVKKYHCYNKKQGNTHNCDTLQIPETILESISAEVLGITEFDGKVFTEKIEKIFVPSAHTLVFHFHNGRKVTREWVSTAAKDCWTPERREAQRQRQLGKKASPETVEKQRAATTRSYANHPERKIADSERMKKFCAENPDWCKEQGEKLLKAYMKKHGGEKT